MVSSPTPTPHFPPSPSHPWRPGPTSPHRWRRWDGRSALGPPGGPQGCSRDLGENPGVAWLPAHAQLLDALHGGLAEGYVDEVDGTLRWPGPRPGPGWHGHGWVPRWLTVFDGQRLTRRRVWRHRYKEVTSGRTLIARCPDERPQLAFSAVVVVLKLWAWLAGAHGIQQVDEVHEALTVAPSPRTVQRWLLRARRGAAWTEQALRDTVIQEGSEPWPAEKLFPGGVPPPEGLCRRRFGEPVEVSTLYRALLWLVGGAVRLQSAIPCLLARARGRWPDPTNQALI